MQVKVNQDGGVQEAIGGSKIDQRLDGDWRLTRDEEVHKKSKVTGGGEGERGGNRGYKDNWFSSLQRGRRLNHF